MLRGVIYGVGTNYLKLVVRLATGVITFRLLYASLAPADFGLFQLLWMSFGYMLLLDFGLGASVQRAIARNRAADAGERGEVIATVFWGYVAMSLAVGVVLLLAGGPLLRSLGYAAQPGPHARQSLAAAIFAVGMIVGFPFGIFREVLRGQNRLYVANAIDLGFMLANLAGLAWVCRRGGGLAQLMGVSVAASTLPALAMAAVAMRDPAMRPRLAAFRASRLRELAGFSVYAYGITATSLLIMQADQFVIGWLIAVEALRIFVPGLKLAALYYAVAAQMQETLGPVAATIDGGDGDRAEALRRLLRAGQRWALLIATPVVLPLAFDFASALRLITGEASPTPGMGATAAWLIAATWISILGSSCTKRILVMIGHHRQLLGLSAIEAAVSLGLGAWLAWSTQDVAGVAVGKFVASVLALLLVPAYACRALGLPLRGFAAACGRGLAGGWAALLVAWIWWTWPPLAQPTPRFLGGCAVVAAAMPIGWWWGGMVAGEREQARRLVRRALGQRAGGRVPAPAA